MFSNEVWCGIASCSDMIFCRKSVKCLYFDQTSREIWRCIHFCNTKIPDSHYYYILNLFIRLTRVPLSVTVDAFIKFMSLCFSHRFYSCWHIHTHNIVTIIIIINAQRQKILKIHENRRYTRQKHLKIYYI